MKKLKLFFACLLMAVLSIGQVWGAVYFEDTFSDVGTGSSGSMLPRDGWSGSGTTAPQYNTGVRLGASSSGATLTKGAMSNIEGTKSLKVTIYVSRYNTNASTLTVTATNGTIASVTLAENVSTGSGLTAGTLTIKPSANAGVTGTQVAATWTDAYKTEFTITGASSSTTIVFSSDKRLILGPVKIEDAASTPSTCTSEITITKADDPANGTFALDNSGTVCIDEGNATVNVTATPNTGYHLATVVSAEGTIGDIEGNTCQITNIGASTTISVTFAANPKYTVSFNVGGSSASQADIAEESAGAGITLPAGPTPTCSADGWVFAGWAEAAVASETTTAPTLLAAGANFKPAADCTLYAVYKKDGGSGGSATVTITPSEITGDADPYTLTHDQAAYTIQINKNGGTKPAVNATAGDARVYANSTLVISNASPMTELVFNISTQGKKRLAPITASVGSIAAQASGDETVTWTGNATEVTFTVGATADYGSDGSSKAGQLDFDNISATAGSSTIYYLSAPTCCEKKAITIASGIENGTVEADLTEACEGATVTLTFTPAGSYHLDSWSVNGTEQDIAENTFTMPATAVTVSATFAHDACENLDAPTLNGTIEPTYNSATIAWTAVTGATGGYAVSVVKDGESEPVFSGNVDALSKALADLEPETQYNYTIMAVGDGTVKCADGNGLLEGNFTTNALPQVQLWLVEKQGETAKNGGTHALGVEFDIPASTLECSKVFRGWTTEAYKDYTHATDAPAVLMNKYTFESEDAVTLYAVYADETPAAATLTKLNGSSMPVAGDKIVIVGIDTNDDSKHALYQETSGSSYVKHWAFDNNVATVAADAKKYVTLEAANDGKFYLGDATNGYVYSSGSNNLSVDLTNKTAWTIAWDADASAFTFNQGRYLSCRSDLTGDNTYLYRLAGGTPAGIWKLDVYKYGTSASTYSNYATTCSNLLDNPTFSLDPVVAPVNDKYEEAINVVITNNAGEGTIYYTTNGENPTSASDEYTAPITLNTCGTKTVKAIVISATNHSEVVTATYEMAIPIPAVSEADPYTEDEAVEVYNSGCYNDEDVYVTGTVQTAQFYSSKTYTITLTNGFQFYYFYESFDGENLVPFENDYIVAGDVLIAKGKLGKHNTTYQIANGYLVSRTPASKTPIDSDIDNPISVAAAVNYIDNAATYDLSEDEFVAGIVESIAECSQHEGTYDIIVLDATDNTKQIKFFGCDVKTFAGIKQYDQITGKGKLFKYYSTYELNYPCEVVALTPYVAPVVDVTGVEVDETATVKVGKTVQLTANVLPINASNKNVTWSVKEGSEAYAEVSATGVVTGKAEGEAVIVVTTEEGSFTDECTVTVTGGINFAAGDFVLVEDANELTEGTYVIVAGSGDNNAAMKYYAGSDNNHKAKAAIKEGKYLHYDSEFGVYEIKNYVVEEVLQGISFYNEDAENYFALPANSNQLKVSAEQNNNSSWTVAVNEGVTTLTNKAFTGRTLRYNSGSSCFASYETGQKTIALYKYVTPAVYRVYYDDNVAEEEIEVPAYQSVNGENKVTITAAVPVRDGYLFGGWKDGEANVYEAGVEYTLSGDITLYAQWTTATVSTLSYNPNGGTLIDGETAIAPADVAEGTNLTIEANVYEKGDNYVFAGWKLNDDIYQPGDAFVMPANNVEFVAQWNEVEVSDYTLVTNVSQLQAGDKIIIVAANYNVAAGSAAATYRNPVTIGKTASKNKLILAGYGTPTEFTLGIPTAGEYTFNDGDGYMYESAAKSIKVREESYSWSISIDGEAIATITGTNALQYNAASGQERFTTYASSQQALQLYRKPGATPDYSRNVTIGNYGTICLPKAGTIEGASIFEIAYYGEASKMIFVDEITSGHMGAGVPYIFQATAAQLKVTYDDKADTDVAAKEANGLHGFYDLENMATDEAAQKDLNEDEGNYILYNNQYWLVSGRAAYINNFRAYIKLSEIDPKEPALAPGRRRVAMAVNGENAATGFENIESGDAPMKVMIEGTMYILRGEKVYDATGRLVK